MIRAKAGVVFAAAMLLAAGLVGCASGSTAPQTGSATSSPGVLSAPLSGDQGAAHLDRGYLQIGTGAKIVDLYLDPMCPYCKMFEHLSGPFLLDQAITGQATLRIHPVALLNRLSRGTDYSSRAAGALTAVAVHNPDGLPAFLTALYENQPPENSDGLTNTQLIELARAHNTAISDFDIRRYASWVNTQTLAATTGPLVTTTQIAAIQQVPTIIVRGNVFPGNSNQPATFTDFYNNH